MLKYYPKCFRPKSSVVKSIPADGRAHLGHVLHAGRAAGDVADHEPEEGDDLKGGLGCQKKVRFEDWVLWYYYANIFATNCIFDAKTAKHEKIIINWGIKKIANFFVHPKKYI
jgi:hypothetical protein